MKLLKRKFLFQAIFFSLFFLQISTTYADLAPTVVPEFVGGVHHNAIWRDKNFFAEAGQCGEKYKCGLVQDPTKLKVCQSQVKTCIAESMKMKGASKQAIAFMNYNNIPSAIYQFRHYALFDVVFAKMQWADADSGFFIITSKGLVIPTFNKIDIQNEMGFQSLLKQYPHALFWNGPDGLTWPEIKKDSEHGLVLVIFDYPIKNGCHACATIGSAKIAYVFDAQGNFIGTRFISIGG